MMQRTISAALLAAILTLGARSEAQTPVITSVTPEAAMAGDEVVITGTNLGLVTHARFTAIVGGFVGVWSMPVPVTSVSSTEVTVTVPLFNSFTQPPAMPAGDPHGSIEVRDAGGTFSNALNFFYMEATFGQTTSAGAGTTQSSGRRAATSFTEAGGAPESGNQGFTLTLDNAVPGSLAFVAFGIAGAPPFPMVGDGQVVIDIFQFYQVLPFTFVADGAGRVFFPIAIPGFSVNLTIAIQWAMVDGVSGAVGVAKGLFTML
jgi:hypothetical protein